jgi:hypothetical protein
MIFATALVSICCQNWKDFLVVTGIFCIGFTAYAFGKWWMQAPVCTTNLLPSWPFGCPAPSWWRFSYTRTKAPFDFVATIIASLAGAGAGILLGAFIRSLAKTAIVVIIIAVVIAVLYFLR